MGDVTAIAYSDERAAKLAGISERRLHRWVARGTLKPSLPGDWWSFRDLVALRTMAEIATKHRIDMRELHKLADGIARRSDRRLEDVKFFVHGREVFFDDGDGAGARSHKPHGQLPTVAVLRTLKPVVLRMKTAAERAFARGADKRGKIATHRGIAGSRPVLDGTRISPLTIKRFSAAGFSVPQILEQYPSLTEEDVRAAIEHEAGESPRRTRRTRAA